MSHGSDAPAEVPAAGPLLRAMLQLEPLSSEMSERELIQEGLEIVQAATSSAIGYLHYVNDDGVTIELGTWSRATLAQCTAVYDRHYPLDVAGIWADAARTCQPCVHNDYLSVGDKRGTPAGHAALTRHLGVPVLEGGRVKMLVGVGNKPTDYDAADVVLVEIVGQRLWSLVRQRRTVEHYLDMQQRFHRVQEIAAVCGWEYDADDDRLHCDAMFATIFLTRGKEQSPRNLEQLLPFVAPADHERVRELLCSGREGARRMLQVACRRASGQAFRAELKVDYRLRDVGHGVFAVGILQDISEQIEVEELRRRADVDALTGLPNRNHLLRLFEHGGIGRRSADGGYAFFYVDLDGFKPVNDTYGHAFGDEVLRIVASRLLHAVRKDDLVVRLGGDEFAVVQPGIGDVDTAAALAQKLIAAVSRPIVLGGRTIHVGASVGIAIRADLSGGLEEVSAAADRALYRAKASGGSCWAAD